MKFEGKVYVEVPEIKPYSCEGYVLMETSKACDHAISHYGCLSRNTIYKLETETNMKTITEINDSHIGKKFTAIIKGQCAEGIIVKEGYHYYLCQNAVNGETPIDRKGYKYGYTVKEGSAHNLYETRVLHLQVEEDVQWVWVSDSSEERARELKGKRILLAKIEGADFPFITVASGEMDKYLSGNKYAITKWKYAVPVEEEEWKPVHICLNNNHTAVVFEDEVHVGCQIFSFELIELLHEAVQKAKQFKNDNK